MSNIIFSPDNMGNAHVYFQNVKLQARIDKHMEDMDMPTGPALIPEGSVDVELSVRQLRQFNAGWDVTVRGDAWSFAHFWGYDAQAVFE